MALLRSNSRWLFSVQTLSIISPPSEAALLLLVVMVTVSLSRFRPPPDPPSDPPSDPPPRKPPPLEAPSPIVPPKPPDPPGVSSLISFLRSSISFSSLSLQVLTRIPDLKSLLPWMLTKISGGGDSTVVYRRFFLAICRSFSCPNVDWLSSSSCSGLSLLPLTGFQVYSISLISAFVSSIEWDLKLFVWMTLEWRTIALVDDVLMDLTYVGPTFVLFGGPYVVSVRSVTAVCSVLTVIYSLIVECNPLSVFIAAFGVVCVFFSFWWQSKEKLIGICSWMNMIMAGIYYPFVSGLEQYLFPIFSHVWSELDVQELLVLQGFSSQQKLSSAFGAVCVVQWVTLDVIVQETYETVVMRFLVVLCVIYIAILSFILPVLWFV